MQIAESSKGFVWRFKSGVHGPKDVFYKDIDVKFPGMALLNLSVWESLDDLRHFIYKSAHSAYYRRRKEWFHEDTGDLPPKGECPLAPHHVLWWIPAGSPPPTFADATERCEHLLQHGETSYAFTMRKPFSCPLESDSSERDVSSAKASDVGGQEDWHLATKLAVAMVFASIMIGSIMRSHRT
eukprot:TRINITY_DN4767_c0_g1_i1.p1 TRINITY_DN4767_c0_g1~~TRINITY_DN4767_c0_g1_i1.p1  ORF type:complete len:183 (+),score=18.15 TRINITY_DN4767_c0_g1_i1:163-711(+)